MRRPQSQFRQFNRSPVDNCAAGDYNPATRRAMATIMGSEGSLHEGEVYNIELTYPQDYPNRPPKIRFLTPIIHPNIDKDGICNIFNFGANWTPYYTINQILVILLNLLDNPVEKIGNQIWQVYNTNPAQYQRMVRQYNRIRQIKENVHHDIRRRGRL